MTIESVTITAQMSESQLREAISMWLHENTGGMLREPFTVESVKFGSDRDDPDGSHVQIEAAVVRLSFHVKPSV
jgi:hypothetical protein